MKLSLALFLVPSVLAWTPPIFLDTFNAEQVEQEQDQDHRNLQMGVTLQNLQNTVTANQPTASPTESPAPSPSPSEPPTAKPTRTANPTAGPTLEPTESPAPSPSPSKPPTGEPTSSPTGFPSASPTLSQVPTAAPTLSRAPSGTPTSTPTGMPSSLPSGFPSSTPTYVADMQSTHVVELGLEKPLVIAETRAFELATAAFVKGFPINIGSISDVSCDVFNQVVKTNPATGTDKQVTKFLQISFVVHVEYTGTDTEFDLFELLDGQFQNKNSNWIRGLADEDTVFQALVPTSMIPVGSQSGQVEDGIDDNGRTSMSKKSYTSILLVSFLALILAIIASVYAIRSHNLNTFGTELRSPTKSQDYELGKKSYSTDDMQAKVTESISNDSSVALPGVMQPPYHAIQNLHHNKSATQESQQKSLSSLPNHTNTANSKQQPRLSNESRIDNLLAEVSTTASPPPPSAHVRSSRVSKTSKKSTTHVRKERDPVAHRASEIQEPPAFSEVNFGRDSSLFDRQSLSSVVSTEVDSHVPGRISDTMAERIAKFEKNSDVSDNGHEMLLTKSFGGTLGAKSVSIPGTASDISSQAKAFFDNLVRKTSEQLNGTTVSHPPTINPTYGKGQPPRGPAATSLPQAHPGQPKSRRSSYEAVLRKPGLYDVFAPPGPIGIVVDTTSNGPAVHSLKNTSPMMGLIAPGDLIVGLDDEDTRGMTAATLTRLMAQKANQKERKISLLTVDS